MEGQGEIKLSVLFNVHSPHPSCLRDERILLLLPLTPSTRTRTSIWETAASTTLFVPPPVPSIHPACNRFSLNPRSYEAFPSRNFSFLFAIRFEEEKKEEESIWSSKGREARLMEYRFQPVEWKSKVCSSEWYTRTREHVRLSRSRLLLNFHLCPRRKCCREVSDNTRDTSLLVNYNLQFRGEAAAKERRRRD